MSNFIPAFHFIKPEDKLKPEFCKQVKDYYFYNTSNRSLLHGKKVKEIDDYASGDFDMRPFMKTFKSTSKKMDANPTPDNSTSPEWFSNVNTTGLTFDPLALIPIKLNSAKSNMLRIPVDVICKAQDALAMKKKKEDINFLKRKPEIKEDLQPIADDMGLGEVDLGTTKHGSVDFEDAPMGLDLKDPEHEALFLQLFYSLKVETAFEKALKQFHSLKKTELVRDLCTEDHLKYGVACPRSFTSSMTGLPDLEYIHPAEMFTPLSNLPDFSDNTHRIQNVWMTVMEMLNYFSDEICDEQTLEEIINGKDNGGGYCSCNKGGPASVNQKSWGTFKVNFKYFEVKSVDSVGVKTSKKSKRGTTTLDATGTDCDSKIWGQNTYGFYWLLNTNYYFKIQRLPGCYRTKGQEAFQNFSTHIYRSQKKSAVELSITENKKAQIAEIKLQHALIKSKPPGTYVDLKYMRAAIDGLKDTVNKWTMDDLLSYFFEHNIMIGDTEDFEGKNEGQFKPFSEILGGLDMRVVGGYLQTIQQASLNISSITGINEQLTGQTSEELVGLQQLQINSGLNAIDYCNKAIKHQWECINNMWALLIEQAVEAGGKRKKAIINMIGEMDTNLIDSLDEAPLHNLTIRTEVGNRFPEQQAYMRQYAILEQKGVVSTVDTYMLNAIENPKEKMQKLYFIEQRWKKEQEQIRTEQYANMQALQQQKSQTDIAVQQQKGQQQTQAIYSKGDVDAKLMQLGNQLGMSQQQIDGLIKKALQKDRNDAQLNKQLKSIQEKANVENQKPYL